MSSQTSEVKTKDAMIFAIEAARLMADLKCDDVVVLDVGGLSQVTRFMVVGTGTSERQMHSVSADLSELGEGGKFPVFRKNDERSSTWTIVDFVDVTAHLFEPNARAFYDLENLWADARRVAWQRAGDGHDGRPRAGR